MVEIPAQLAGKIAKFCLDKKTGTVVLDVVNGKIIAYKLTESGRVDKVR